jgi:hypothetical protein
METPAALNVEQVPPELVEAGASGRLVVVVGPGANIGTGLPTWKALLNLLLDRARTSLPPTRHDELDEAGEWFRTDGEELLKATLLRQMMGEDGLATAIADVLRRFPASPAPIHRALAELPGATFITTNYDALLEAAFADQTSALPAVVRLSDIDGLRRFTVGQVLKLHGDIDHPKTIVLSSEDYLRTRNTAARVWKERLRTLVKAHSQFLFLGYGYGESDVLPVLNELRAALGEALHTPFWIDVNGVRQRASAGTAGLRAVLFASADGIEPWLRELGRAIRHTARLPGEVDALAGDAASADWQPRKEPGEIKIAAPDTDTPTTSSFHPLNVQNALEAYQNGRLAFESLCELTGRHAATWVIELCDSSAAPGTFSPPAPIPSHQASPIDLNGKQIVVGELELLLLQKLGLLSDLLKALANGGRLLVFSDSWWKIGESASELQPPNEPRPSAAAQLADEVKRSINTGIAQGIVDLVERSPIPDLPAPRDADPDLGSTSHQLSHLAHTLAYREALVEHSARWLLVTDYCVTASLGNDPRFLLRLAFRDAEHFTSLCQRLDQASDRVVHLPRLVRSLLPDSKHRNEILLRLATLGFPDALVAHELLHFALTFIKEEARQDHGSDTSTNELPRVFEGMERIARDPAHPGAPLARICIADTFATALWEVFRDDIAERDAIASLLLRRAENIDSATAGSLLELVIQFAGGFALRKTKFSFEPTTSDKEIVELSNASPVGKFWGCLADWVGPDGTRRAAYARAVRWIWLKMVEFSGLDGPQRHASAPMILPIRARPTNTMEPEIQAPATLSADWVHKPLARVRPGGAGEERSVERILQQGATLLSANSRKINFDEARASYPSFDGEVVVVPVEAILLRAAPEAATEFARHLAWKQGPHDGRAYDLLQELATRPEDKALRRDYARMTTTAPWRLVREDPTVIHAWPQRRQLDEFPGTTEHLREMLSEPQGNLPSKMTIFDILSARLADGGAWQTRLDRVELCAQASSLPGVLPAFMLRVRVDLDAVEYAEEVMQALQRLDKPHGEPVARLVGDIFFLRIAAVRRPYVVLPEGEIDLRERLPERLAAVLRAVKSAPPLDTFADSEAALLRICGRVVHELSLPEGLPSKDRLWLTYRLFQWLVAQLEAMAPDARYAGLLALRKVSPSPDSFSTDVGDLLDPFQFDNGRLNHRLAAVLYAYTIMDELRIQLPGGPDDAKETPRAVTSSALEDLLAELAARPLSTEERVLRARGDSPSCLDWHGPGAVPDLALKALLQQNSEAFFRIPPEARLRWIQDLPRNMDESEQLSWSLASDLVATATNHAKHLSSREKIAFEEYLRSLDGDDHRAPKAYRWQWLGFTELYGAGALHLEKEVQDLLLENRFSPAAPAAFGSYLAALSFVAPDRLESEAERILAVVEAEPKGHGGIDPVAFASAVARVLITGNPASIPVAQSILRRLAQRPPYQGAEPIVRLLNMLRLL